ncbi:MarR family winged helix-turn-helix transcriptional regulator [Neorhizobium galegae]|nr:MarR family winged helix-turn-helix transcriptional regulator [Neorhizobium galegae]MCM2500682.1 MarR family winged helix-turn-helix transcriptional regulator [Neorhizobium galegae]MCQ1770641.1 MarR family winged helix-turn-helix transcriptional regulator [Neorhizobium galegae]MCQ1777545.1 MarR family winged helix-turn-helix transcriptional regulator [Neorhizobium galegae]MCQ1794703.1 MarR family winged helix-turn-helix transcriptional regulator [Neorhizobium galegae]
MSNTPTIEVIPFSTTLLVRDTCLCLHVQRAARALARRFDNAMKPIGLTNGQFSLMMSLNRPQPAPMGQVASLLAMDRTTLTAALKVLERRGLVETTVDPKDRRGRLLRLTDDGMTMLSAALPIWKRVHAQIDAELGEGGAEELRATLTTFK